VKNLVLLEERIVQLLNKLKENHLLISQLSEENQGLEKQNLDFKEKVSHLKSENESLKVANSLLGSEESKAVTKRKINSLIKEVDFCIHQLTEIN
jgi:predicted RNase H-like nuclease (RuvC/YqgF family)